MTDDLTPEQIDLLLRIAEGSLTGEEQTRVAGLMDADPSFADEVKRQREAISFLASERAAPLADFEAARMRRLVLAEVAPATKPKTSKWLSRALPVAAALAVVVLGIGFLSQPQGGSDSESAGDVTSQAADSTEAPAATEAAAAEMAPSEVEDMADGADAPAADESLPYEDSVLAAVAPIALLGDVDERTLLDVITEAKSAPEEGRLAVDVPGCGPDDLLVAGVGEEVTFIGSGVWLPTEEPVWILQSPDPQGEEVTTVISADNCSIVFTTGD